MAASSLEQANKKIRNEHQQMHCSKRDNMNGYDPIVLIRCINCGSNRPNRSGSTKAGSLRPGGAPCYWRADGRKFGQINR
jgi:hypothetical protein